MEKLFYGKNRKAFIAIYFLLLVAWLSFIFYNSFADAEVSTEQSNRVVQFLQNIVHSFAPEVMVDAEAVRTTAHFVEFFVLGFLYYVGSFFIKACRITLFAHTLSLSLFTAFIDETIQLYSNGRGADVRDIWVDFAGALVAHLVVFICYYTYKHIKTA